MTTKEFAELVAKRIQMNFEPNRERELSMWFDWLGEYSQRQFNVEYDKENA